MFHCDVVSITFNDIDTSFRYFVQRFRIILHTMDRPDKRKPLTPEIKGSLITLYRLGLSIGQIAEELDCHVS